MSNSHVHNWVKESVTYACPVWIDHIETRSSFDLRSLLMGLTTFVYRCSDPICGELKKIEALGKVIEEKN